ncbi:hypothetical protein F5X97DRAFT_340924 [Nemania serpens]|nr:hypothetical protein F5X97DRAFT_340924 [Nemania serpens]
MHKERWEPTTSENGEPRVMWDEKTRAVVEYQTVTSHGNAAVSDARSPTVIQHTACGAVLKRPDDKPGKGVVHVPISAPVSMIPPSALLQNIVVTFTSEKSAAVEAVTLFYDSCSVAGVNFESKNAVSHSPDFAQTKTFFIDFSKSEREAAAYWADKPKGICLTLSINFPDKDACIGLSAVKLVYLYDIIQKPAEDHKIDILPSQW